MARFPYEIFVAGTVPASSLDDAETATLIENIIRSVNIALAGPKLIDLPEKTASGFEAMLICADHDAVDYDALVTASRLVVDTRNVTITLSRGRVRVVRA